MPDVCVLSFLRVAGHRRRSGRHLCDVPGLCHPIRHDVQIEECRPVSRSVCDTRVGPCQGVEGRDSRWSLPSPSRGTEQRVFRHSGDTRIDDLLSGRGC